MVCFSALSSAQSKDGKGEKKASIALDSTVARMGEFPKSGGPVSVVFTFKNVGDEKLVLYNAAPDCGCVSVELPKKPVKPGKKGAFTVTYNGKRKKPGRFTHKINFAYNGDPFLFEVRIKGVMTEN